MKVYIIHGPPLSGKSTYVKNNIGPNDLVYDFDILMSSISGKDIHIHNENLLGYVLDIRDLILSKLKSEENIENVYIITTRITNDLKKKLVGLNPVYIKIDADKPTVLKRLKNNPGNRDIDEWSQAIDKYFMSTKDYSDFHNKKAWRDKRIVILKRDGYQCRECKRYGKIIEADTVHHILPIEERYDLRLNNKNLLSLCESCHEKMHDKFNNKLSKLGLEWRNRTIGKHPELRSPLS